MLYGDRQCESTKDALRRVYNEFVATVSEKPIDAVQDVDSKMFERRLAARKLANATQRS